MEVVGYLLELLLLAPLLVLGGVRAVLQELQKLLVLRLKYFKALPLVVLARVALLVLHDCNALPDRDFLVENLVYNRHFAALVALSPAVRDELRLAGALGLPDYLHALAVYLFRQRDYGHARIVGRRALDVAFVHHLAGVHGGLLDVEVDRGFWHLALVAPLLLDLTLRPLLLLLLLLKLHLLL